MPAPRTNCSGGRYWNGSRLTGVQSIGLAWRRNKEPTRTHSCAEVPVILDIGIVLDRVLVKREDAIYACHLLLTGSGDQFRCAGAT